MSRLQKVDLAFSYFLILIFISFWFIFIFLFLELRVRVSDDITQSHDMVTVTVTSHMMHGRTKKVPEEVMSYNMYTIYFTHGTGCTVVSMDHVNRYVR